MSDAQVLVTGKYFSGLGLRAIGPVLQELVLSAQVELHLMSYLLTEPAAPLVDLLEAVLEKGVRVTVVINAFEGNSQFLLSRLQTLGDRHAHARVFVYSDEQSGPLHAKVLVATGREPSLGLPTYLGVEWLRTMKSPFWWRIIQHGHWPASSTGLRHN